METISEAEKNAHLLFVVREPAQLRAHTPPNNLS
jgi:hypothetical protein